MNRERVKKLLPVITAFANGEDIECSATNWKTKETLTAESDVSFNYRDMDYRIKPKPVTRSWQSIKDLPGPICWIRYQGKEENGVLIVAARPEGVVIIRYYDDPPALKTWDDLTHHEWSTDLKTWQPCTITEQA